MAEHDHFLSVRHWRRCCCSGEWNCHHAVVLFRQFSLRCRVGSLHSNNRKVDDAILENCGGGSKSENLWGSKKASVELFTPCRKLWLITELLIMWENFVLYANEHATVQLMSHFNLSRWEIRHAAVRETASHVITITLPVVSWLVVMRYPLTLWEES